MRPLHEPILIKVYNCNFGTNPLFHCQFLLGAIQVEWV